MDSRKKDRIKYISLMLQTGLAEDELAKVFGLSENTVRQMKNDIAKKVRHPSSPSSRGTSKSDLLVGQLLVLLKLSGFDLHSMQFNDDMMISSVMQGDVEYGFSGDAKDLLEDVTLKELFNLDKVQAGKIKAINAGEIKS